MQLGAYRLGRWRAAAGHNECGCRSDRSAGAGEPRVAAGEHDPEAGIGFLCGGARPPVEVKVAFVEEHRDEHGVEPICAALQDTPAQIAPSTYCAHRSRGPSARAVRDQQLTEEIRGVHAENLGVYGARKVHAELNRKRAGTGQNVARCTVERLMSAAGLHGIPHPHHDQRRRPDTPPRRPGRTRLHRHGPNRLWVADIYNADVGIICRSARVH